MAEFYQPDKNRIHEENVKTPDVVNPAASQSPRPDGTTLTPPNLDETKKDELKKVIEEKKNV